MTKNRDFKKLVRARMARTGERYAAARAQLTHDSATARPGIHPETAALVRLLVAAGVTGPDGAAPSEALVLGLGGGIGAAAFVFEYKGHTPTFYVATRCQPQYAYDAAFVTTAAERLGATCDVTESTSPAAAARKLAERVARGPVMAWVDMAAMPWVPRVGPVAEMGAMPHVIVVDAIEGDTASVHDVPSTPLTIGLAELAAGRKRLRAGKHRLLSIGKGTPADPRDGIREAIAACSAELGGRTKIRGPMAKNFGVPGLKRWATAMTAPKDPKRWTKVFPPQHAAGVLAWMRSWIDLASTGGGGFRPLYAEFLDCAASIVKQPALRAIARDYRTLGAEWTALGVAALPDRITKLAAIRKAQDARYTAYRSGDIPAMRTAETTLFSALAAAGASPPFDAEALAAHYKELATRLTSIIDAEEACAQRLATVFD